MRLLQDGLAASANRQPEAPAIVDGETTLTYGQLDEASSRLARLFQEHGCVRGDRVCLLLPKSPEAIVAMLAALKAGCAYVPVSPSGPAARVARILSSCEPRLLILTGAVRPLLDEVFSTGAAPPLGVGTLEPAAIAGERFRTLFCGADLAATRGDPAPRNCTSSDAAHILFTSGSTGEPKGVVITHQNVLCFVDWANAYFGAGEGERWSGQTPIHFDLSTYDIYGAIHAGAALHLVPPELGMMPKRLSAFIREARLTQWFSVPSVFNYMAKFDAVAQDDFPSLRRVLWCGEVLPTPTLIYWMQRLPHASFTNLYGPTEATIASSYHTLERCPEDPRAPVPIGRACGGERLLVLDAERRPVPQGSNGDLYIQGAGLSPGYWRDPEKTAAAFLPHPDEPGERIYRTGDLASVGPDGLFHFHGRADTQIKSRGYRIELGEIECALQTLPLLKECAVVAIDLGGFEGALICCAFAPLEGAHVTPIELRSLLARLLPAYMIPARWLALPALPKNVNGKIDRPRLKESFLADAH